MKLTRLLLLFLLININSFASASSHTIYDDSISEFIIQPKQIKLATPLPTETVQFQYDNKKDIYFREFSSPEALKQFKCLATDVDEKLLQVQDRRRIIGEGIFKDPYNYHFFLEMIYYNIGPNKTSKIYYGSAILIANNLLLTAAHNLFDLLDGGYPDELRCYGACHLNKVLAESIVFPKKDDSSVFVPKAYQEKLDPASDIALVIFTSEVAAKIATSGLKFALPVSLPSTFFKGKKFNITGYPGVRSAYSHEGDVLGEVESNRIKYDIDTTKGQSGSGIWFLHKDHGVVCVGTHTSAGQDAQPFNLGVLINEEFKSKIESLI
ncbi:MAG: hypothetical protein BGO77_03925 [Caedibacter sp. 37-49]|nr:MAG: hypothetical protein BGO77_03925 [Caedibacter sp. 37-49]